MNIPDTLNKWALALSLTVLIGSASNAADPLLSYRAEIIAKAQPDEFFYSLYDPEIPGSGENVYKKSGYTPNTEEWHTHINAGGLPKINQSYVWGMTRKENYLWFGTGPNVNRLVSGVYFGAETGSISQNTSGTTFSATEYADSQFARVGVYDLDADLMRGPAVAPTIGDWRPPDLYRYNLDTDTQENLYLNMDPEEQALIWKTLGLRSAGYTASNTVHSQGLVFLAGPSTTATDAEGGDGVIMFAFDADDGDCVGAKSFPAYSNIRKWKSHEDQLYTTIATQTGSGQVLRWVNDPEDTLYPFEFEVVGQLDAGGAELEVHEGRLFVNTWPGIEGNLDIGGDITTIINIINSPAGLWRSPTIPEGGLNSSHAGNWTKVWSITEYEPDLVVALHYGGGAMASFDGYLYWGTMHVPLTSNIAHRIGYGSPTRPTAPTAPGEAATPEELEAYALELEAYELALEAYSDAITLDFRNSYRAISIFRGKNFSNNSGEIDLVYGSESMPARLERTVFTENNDPRNDLYVLKWNIFFTDNIGNLRSIPDGYTTPTFLGYFSNETITDGGDWNETPNTSGYTPLFGPEGIIPRDYGYGITFPWNNYTWTMQVFDGKLYIGTMDWDDISSPDPADGADLFCIPSADQPAIRVSGLGMANWSSYGIRTIAADDTRGELYLGMANVQNMLSTTVGDPVDGGWEIQRVTMRYPDDDLDELDDVWETEQFGSTSAKNDATGNSDNDSLNDYEEWLAGTDPNNSNSHFFTVLQASETEGLQQIEWSTVGTEPARYYTVYEATDLGGIWTPVATHAGTGSSITHEYNPADSSAKFFKIGVSLDAPTP